jgi:hypothetical protein
MTTDTIVVERLRRLHDEYVEKVNMAVHEDRDDLVDVLVREYPEAARRVTEGATAGV